MGTHAPAMPQEIIKYMMGRPLDFDPGTREAYSNFGYCVLGRVIEKTSRVSYENYVQREVLSPLGIRRMRQGRSLENQRAEQEVQYYPRSDAHVESVFGGGTVPVAYGGWCIEAMDSHGGWIASATDLVRFASAFEDPQRCPILNKSSIEEMFARPLITGFDAAGKPKAAYYACGWQVRPTRNGKPNTWHNGQLDGTSTLLVHRYDDLTWAVLFNADFGKNHKSLSRLIDPLMHQVADGIESWPE
jgi:N-acyl-D-amino-acid deacylase